MASTIYQIKQHLNKEFWDQLVSMPKQGDNYPKVVRLEGVGSFGYAPWNVLDGYADFQDPMTAMTYLVPNTPSPITSIQYFMAPQQGLNRKIFVVFWYAHEQGIIAECGPLALLHKPFGLRIGGAAVNNQFTVNTTIIKGDEAPIHIILQSAKNPDLGLSITEYPTGDGMSWLDIVLKVPGMSTISVNPYNAPPTI